MDLEQPLAALGGRIPKANWSRPGLPSGYGEIREEDARLAAWAKESGRFLGPQDLAALASQAVMRDGGEEHEVLLFHADDEGFVLRFTQGNMFGRPGRGPREYLSRWRTFNRLFPVAAVEFEAYALNAWGNGIIITRQPLINGGKRSIEDISEAMLRFGFEANPERDFSYVHQATGLGLRDAHEGNVLFDPDGNMMPIDVWVHDPNDCLE